MFKYCMCNSINKVFDRKGNCSICGRPFRKIVCRKKWHRKPQTQIKKSDKLYNRKKSKRKFKKRLKEE